MDMDMDMTNITTAAEKEAKEHEQQQQQQQSQFLDRKSDNIHFFIQFFMFLLAKSKVKLVSSDGQCFTLDYDCVIQSGTIKSLLESSPSN